MKIFTAGFISLVLATTDLVSAATLSVTNLADSGPGTLRQTIANSISGDTITFAPSLSGASLGLTGGELLLNKNLTIDASGLPDGIILNGNHNDRIFEVAAGTVVMLNALTLENGYLDPLLPNSGGAIYNNGGTLTVNRCTLTGNSTGNNGGGISTQGAAGSLTVNQCTLTGNSAGLAGGGVYRSSGSLTVNQSTISGNTAGTSGGGISMNLTTGKTITNSIVAGNTPNNITGSFTGGANFTNANPGIAPLGYHGGPTPTMPPFSSSPVIDGCTNGTSFTTDQRGFTRILGPFADIGAVESETSLPTLTVNPEVDQQSFRSYAGPIAPPAQTNFTYSLSNSGPAELNWALDLSTDWLSSGAIGGTLAGGATTNIEVYLNDNAYLLGDTSDPIGWTGVVSFVNLTSQSTIERRINFQVLQRVSSGGVSLWGASPSAPPFIPGLFRVSLEPTNLIATGAAWHPVGATPDPGWSQDTTNWYYPITRSNTLEFLPVAGYLTPTNQPVLVNPNDPVVIRASYGAINRSLTVTPAGALNFTGASGGPFVPVSLALALTNLGTGDLEWSLGQTASWIAVSASNGTLRDSAAMTVAIQLNTNASRLTPGDYTNTLRFTNLTTGFGNTNLILTLTVVPPIPILLFGPETIGGGGLRLTLSGTIGKAYAIEASSNLLSWMDQQFLTNTTGTNAFTNTAVIGEGKKFFRARQLP